MKSFSATLAIVASLLISTIALAQDQNDTGQAITGAPSDGTKDALEVVIDGAAAKNIYQNMKIEPLMLGHETMAFKRGANMSCYASVQTELYLCIFEVNQDGTTKGRQ